MAQWHCIRNVGGEIWISFQHAGLILALQSGPSACLDL